jgi:Rab GDP dissociation inhibitor
MKKMDLRKIPFSKVAKHFDLGKDTLEFIGHAVALYTTDDFINRPAYEVYEKIILYMDSID